MSGGGSNDGGGQNGIQSLTGMQSAPQVPQAQGQWGAMGQMALANPALAATFRTGITNLMNRNRPNQQLPQQAKAYGVNGMPSQNGGPADFMKGLFQQFQQQQAIMSGGGPSTSPYPAPPQTFGQMQPTPAPQAQPPLSGAFPQFQQGAAVPMQVPAQQQMVAGPSGLAPPAAPFMPAMGMARGGSVGDFTDYMRRLRAGQ